MPYANEEERIDARIAGGDPKAGVTGPVIRQWEDRRKAAEDFCFEYFVKAKKLAAFYLGHQWLLTARRRVDGYMVAPLEADAPYRVRATINLFRQHVNARRARILVDQPIPVAQPANADEAAQEAADIATQFLQYRDSVEWQADWHWQRLAAHITATGLGWILDFWDPNRTAAARDQESGMVLNQRIGSIVTQIFPAWDVLWQPGQTATESLYYIRREVRTIGELRDQYPQRGIYVTGDAAEVGESEAGTDRMNPLERALSGWLSGENPGSVNTGAERSLKRVTVRQGYEKLGPGGDACGVWRVVTWCGNVLLADETVEWQPLTAVVYDSFLGNPFPCSMGEDLVDPQERLNKMESRKQEHFNLSTHPKILIPREGGINGISNAPGELVEFSGGTPPSYLEPPGLRPEVVDEPSNQARWMGELSGVHEVSQGRLPTSQLSGTAIAQLQEKDTTNSQHAVANFKSALLVHFRNELKIANAFFDVPRWIAIVGKDSQWDVEEFTGKDIEGVRAVRLQVGTSVPLMPAQKHAFVLEMQTRGLFQEGREKELQQVMEWLEYGLPQKTLRTTAEQAVATARREQVNLEKKGVMADPYHLEDHGAHLEAHMTYVNTMKFRMLGSREKQAMAQHIEIHELMLVKKAAEEAQKAQLVQSGGQEPEPAMGMMGAGPERNNGGGTGNGR